MKTSDDLGVSRRSGFRVAGASGIVLAITYLGVAMQLPMGSLDQPGAGIFPLVVGGLLLLASMATWLEGMLGRNEETVRFPDAAGRRRLFGLLALLLAYFTLLPWVGQALAGALFCLLLMRLLSERPWFYLMASTLAITAALYLLFVVLLKVPLPRGALWP